MSRVHSVSQLPLTSVSYPHAQQQKRAPHVLFQGQVTSLPGAQTSRALVFFKGRETDADLVARFKRDFDIDVDLITQVRAVSDQSRAVAASLSKAEVRRLVIRALRTYDQAWKNSRLENFSNRYFSSSMQFDTGRWAVATNIEHDGECIYCGERSAIVRLWNEELEKTDVAVFQDDDALDALRQKLHVKNLVMGSGSDPFATSITGSPCSDCSHMMSTGRFFSPDTKVSLLCKDGETGEYYLGLKLLGDILPMMGKRQISVTEQKIKNLPVEISERAAAYAEQAGWEKKQLKKAARAHLKEAKNHFEDRATHDYNLVGPGEDKKSAQRVSVAVMLNPGKNVQTAERLEYTKRWNVSAEQAASVLGYDEFADQTGAEDLNMDLIAYYGTDKNQIPHIESLGRVSQVRGSGNTFLAVIEKNGDGDDVIKVRTIYDYMPYLYISSTTRQKPKS